MPRHPLDRLLPTACLLVSRAWVIENVSTVDGVDEATRRAWVDDLCGYEPPREHGLRNSMLFWVTALGAAPAANALGLPGWTGFVAALMLFGALARALATRTLRWRLAILRSEAAPKGADPATRSA